MKYNKTCFSQVQQVVNSANNVSTLRIRTANDLIKTCIINRNECKQTTWGLTVHLLQASGNICTGELIKIRNKRENNSHNETMNERDRSISSPHTPALLNQSLATDWVITSNETAEHKEQSNSKKMKTGEAGWG